MKKIFFSIFIFILLLSLGIFFFFDEKTEENFEDVAFLKLSSSFRVESLHPEYEKEKKPIQNPPATWENLLRFYAYGQDDYETKIYCLNYEIPYLKEKIKGRLRLEEADGVGNCHEGREKKILTEIDRIDEFFYFFKNAPSKLLILNITSDKKDIQLEIPLMNIELPKEDFSRYSLSKKERYLTGAQVLSYGSPNRKISRIKTPFEELFFEKAQRCHNVSSDCKDLSQNLCSSCPFGFFEAVGAVCPQGYIKFCGPIHCGGVKEPACPRGVEFSELQNPCFEGSNAGFCAEGLHTYCDENKMLICL